MAGMGSMHASSNNLGASPVERLRQLNHFTNTSSTTLQTPAQPLYKRSGMGSMGSSSHNLGASPVERLPSNGGGPSNGHGGGSSNGSNGHGGGQGGHAGHAHSQVIFVYSYTW